MKSLVLVFMTLESFLLQEVYGLIKIITVKIFYYSTKSKYPFNSFFAKISSENLSNKHFTIKKSIRFEYLTKFYIFTKHIRFDLMNKFTQNKN